MISDSEITECWKLITQDKLVDAKEIPIRDGLVFGREIDSDVFIASDHVSRKHAKLEVFEKLVRIVDLGSANGTYINGERITEAELNNGDILAIDKVEFIVLKPDFTLGDIPDDKTRVRTAVDINKTQCRSSVRLDPEARQQAELVEEDSGDTQVLQAVGTKPHSQNPQEEAGANEQAIDLNLDDAGDDSKDTVPQQDNPDSPEAPDSSDDVTMMMSSTDAFETEPEKLHNTFKLDTPVAHLVCKTKPYQGKIFDVSASPTTIGRVQNNDITIGEASVSSRHAELRFEHGNWHIYDQDSYNGTYVNREKCKSRKLKHGDVIGIGRMQLQFEMASQPGISMGKIPLWLMVSVFVLLIAGVAAYFLWPSMSQPRLSTSSLWMQIVADNRADPTTPVADDISRDGVRDIIIAAQSGRVEMINGANGLSLSAFNIDKSIHSAPLVFDVNQDGLSDIVVASDDGSLVAYTQNGIPIWEYQGEPLTAIYNRIVARYLNGDNTEDILVSTAKQGLVAVDGRNGKKLWDTAKYVKGQVITSPLIGDFNQDAMPDMAVVTDQDKIYAFTGRGEQVSLLWEKAVPKVLFASPVLLKTPFNSMIFLATQENGLIALNGLTGSRVWLTPLRDIVYASPVIVQSTDAGSYHVIVATLSGKVVALNAKDGVIVWETHLGRKLQTSPLLFSHQSSADKYLLVADTRGGYSVLNASNGKRLLTEKQEGADRFVVTPLMVDLNNDGQPEVVLASQNGRIFAREFQFR